MALSLVFVRWGRRSWKRNWRRPARDEALPSLLLLLLLLLLLPLDLLGVVVAVTVATARSVFGLKFDRALKKITDNRKYYCLQSESGFANIQNMGPKIRLQLGDCCMNDIKFDTS